jgi:hypothetical protein
VPPRLRDLDRQARLHRGPGPGPHPLWPRPGAGATPSLDLLTAAAGQSRLEGPPSTATVALLPAPVAQLERASGYGSEGCRFESCRVRLAAGPGFSWALRRFCSCGLLSLGPPWSGGCFQAWISPNRARIMRGAGPRVCGVAGRRVVGGKKGGLGTGDWVFGSVARHSCAGPCARIGMASAAMALPGRIATPTLTAHGTHRSTG